MKRLLTGTLIALSALGAICAFSACSSGKKPMLQYDLNQDGESYAVSFHGTGVKGKIEIPSSYEGKPVTKIGDYAFSGCDGLTSVVVPDTVTEIGDCAFYGCYKMTSANIPANVTEIGYRAFDGCGALASLTLPHGLTLIEGGAFRGCSSLTEITIPEGVTAIRENAFSACHALTGITVPEGVTSVGENAFSSCFNLQSVSLPSTLTRIGSAAFSYCEKLTDVTLPEGITSVEDSLFEYCEALNRVGLPDGVTAIGRSAFHRCLSLTEVSLPDGVTFLGRNAFESCALKSVKLPNGIKTVNEFVFQGNTLLSSVELPDGVTSIESYAFEGCSALTEIVIPEGVTQISGRAFSGCGLKSVTIPAALKSVGDGVFADCADLESIVWNAVKCDEPNVGNFLNIFTNCSCLSSFTLGESVEQLPPSLFRVRNVLTQISVREGNPNFHVAGNCLIATREKELVLGFSDSRIPSDGSVTSIRRSAFENCGGLTSIVIPDSVVTVGDYAFFRCENLTDVTLGAGVEVIGNYAFAACRGLTSVVIPDSVVTVGNSAFSQCENLADVTIGAGVETFGANAFIYCSKITNIYIKDLAAWCRIEVADINSRPNLFAENIFLNGERVREFVIPEGITEIGDFAFTGFQSIESVYLSNSVVKIGVYAFRGCSNVNHIYVDDLETWHNLSWDNPIGPLPASYDLYAGGTLVTEVTLPERATVKQGAFQGCKSIERVVIPRTVKKIEDNAFADCEGLIEIVFEGTKEEWKAIDKALGWNEDMGEYTVRCSDGELKETGEVIVFSPD